jgi:hypothetical protein
MSGKIGRSRISSFYFNEEVYAFEGRSMEQLLNGLEARLEGIVFDRARGDDTGEAYVRIRDEDDGKGHPVRTEELREGKQTRVRRELIKTQSKRRTVNLHVTFRATQGALFLILFDFDRSDKPRSRSVIWASHDRQTDLSVQEAHQAC